MCVCVCVCVQSLSCVQLFVTPWTVAHQALLSMGFSRQEYWSGLPFPSPGDLPDPGIKPGSPALPADYLPAELPCLWVKATLLSGKRKSDYRLHFRGWKHISNRTSQSYLNELSEYRVSLCTYEDSYTNSTHSSLKGHLICTSNPWELNFKPLTSTAQKAKFEVCDTSFSNVIRNFVGKQNLPPHRMSLQHADYFMMIIFKKQTVHEVLLFTCPLPVYRPQRKCLA